MSGYCEDCGNMACICAFIPDKEITIYPISYSRIVEIIHSHVVSMDDEIINRIADAVCKKLKEQND
jgi:hypothetical protein